MSGSVGGFFCFLIVVGIVAAGVFLYKKFGARIGALSTPDLTAATFDAIPFAEFTTTLRVPSSLPQLKFHCPVTIRYRVDSPPPEGSEPASIAEWEVYKAAQTICARYPLTVKEHLDLALNEELHKSRSTADGGITISAHCGTVTAEANDLTLAKRLELERFELAMEDGLEDMRLRRAERLGRILSEPRNAALWWLARHPDRIKELPQTIELMFTLNQQLNHRPPGVVFTPAHGSFGPVGPTHGGDLDELLADANERTRALIGNTLAVVYERIGRDDLAERARALSDIAVPRQEDEPV